MCIHLPTRIFILSLRRTPYPPPSVFCIATPNLDRILLPRSGFNGRAHILLPCSLPHFGSAQPIVRPHLRMGPFFRRGFPSDEAPKWTKEFRSGRVENGDLREPARSVRLVREHRKRRRLPFAGRHHLKTECILTTCRSNWRIADMSVPALLTIRSKYICVFVAVGAAPYPPPSDPLLATPDLGRILLPRLGSTRFGAYPPPLHRALTFDLASALS